MNIKYRKTKKQMKILDIFKEEKSPISASQLYEKINTIYTTNLSTIYRSLQKLEELEIIKKSMYQNGTCYYTLNSNDDIHYLVCNKCNEVVKLNSCPLTKVIKDISNKTGFSITSHDVKLNGICPKCKEEINK